MADFELNYKQESDYYNSVDFKIKLGIKPSKVDLDAILDALETIEDFADKYLKKIVPIVTGDAK